MAEGSCSLCPENDSRVLKEEHHTFTRNYNAKEIILLCHNCHDKITYEQNKLSPKIRKATKGIPQIVFVLRSIGALLEVAGRNLIRISDSLMEEYDKCQK